MAIHFDTQGPAPDGFHVPLTDEWQGLNTIMTSLSLTTGDAWRINLHMPFAGYRYLSNAAHDSQGSYGRYWSSSPRGATTSARYLDLDSYNVPENYNSYRAYGFSIRCFKDSYVAPDSSWTVVQGTLGSAGIFWNQSQGLISITNGTTGYTIQDKNLGATTVYNNGDTLTQANMGNMYQWGNNYGFPSTGNVTTTSSTQVDATNYGPGNYYESSTFITGSNDWSSVYNDNLWGGVTQGTWSDPMRLHGAIQTFHRNLPKLKTYSELVAMATSEGYPRTNTIAELNTAEDDYYNMLNDGGHIGTKSFEDVGTRPYIIGIQSGTIDGYNIKKGGNSYTEWSVGHYIPD